MNAMAESLLQQALTLDEEGRAEIAGALIQSLHSQTDQSAETAWDLEIDRRVQQIDEGSVELTPWAGVRKRLFE